jgi:murein DD-endopeptidase MepM/ murein hydrolase activator NlpD
VPVYLTGDAVVTFTGWKQGYGRTIEVNHGYGYVTRYAHLLKIEVKVGQSLKRGERIGQVGSSGKSTGPHLHYEVIFRGRNVDPINYFFLDLSPQEYDRLIQEAANN